MSRAPHVSVKRAISGETLGQFGRRTRKDGPRKPLRTLRELADEFGVPHKTLQVKLARCKGAPKPVFSTGGRGTPQNTWYDPDEVRAWWKFQREE